MSFGFVFRDANGAVTLTNQNTGLRLIDARDYPGGHDGTDSVPEFDDTRGMLTIVQAMLITANSGGDRVAYDARVDNLNSPNIYEPTLEIPQLTWDNTAKVLTIKPAIYDGVGTFRPLDFEVRFFHFR